MKRGEEVKGVRGRVKGRGKRKGGGRRVGKSEQKKRGGGVMHSVNNKLQKHNRKDTIVEGFWRPLVS